MQTADSPPESTARPPARPRGLPVLPRPDYAGALAMGGRWALLFLLAGHLLLRREFAHRNVGELFTLLHVPAPAILNSAYVTELVLAALLPVALTVFFLQVLRPPPNEDGTPAPRRALGAAFYIALGLLGWGAAHALAAWMTPAHDTYLVLRQSMFCGYAVVFLYAVLFFGAREKAVRNAALFVLATAVCCALLDSLGLLNQRPGTVSLYPDEPIFGQQVLPLGMLGFALLVVCSDTNWRVRIGAIAALSLLGWREMQRTPQSVVLLGLGGTLGLYVLWGALLAVFGQRNTLRRALLLVAFVALSLFAYRTFRAPLGQTRGEIGAWSLAKYQRLFEVYDRTPIPTYPTHVQSMRPPYVLVTDPEVHKLNAVYEAAQSAGGVSVVNNIWRLLIWRRMLNDWRAGAMWTGAGVGQAWFYPALYHTRFHFGETREGLDPHNSYLHFLYRFGVIGFALLAGTILCALAAAWSRLRRRHTGGEVLEGVLLGFAYCAIFAAFTVALEGPSYGLPFWFALALAQCQVQR